MTDIQYTDEQTDALQEIINIAMGRAVASLASILDVRVGLSVPRVHLVQIHELIDAIQEITGAANEVTVVSQAFYANQHDGLTSIYNRHYIEDILSKEFSRSQRYGGLFSLIMMDLEYFKEINDRFGHLAGDTVLRSVTSIIDKMLRDSDTFGRYGGEEFAIILPETPLEHAMLVAKRISTTIAADPIPYEGKAIPITISAGVAQSHSLLRRHEDLIREADTALYQSKKQGRNRVTQFRPKSQRLLQTQGDA